MRRPRSLRLLVGLTVVILVMAALGSRHCGKAVRYTTAASDRGEILETVGATGTLEAMITVQVGSQVSGTVQELRADFNSLVKKGQVIARLEPSSFEARLAQARANLVAARANVEKAEAALVDARQKYDRAQRLSREQLLPATDLETARANFESARAQLEASRAAVTQADATRDQAEVDFHHTIIRAPIDGIVIARSVDVGQTVAASLQAPVLFVIANDLSQMRVNASVDEADVGKVRPGQEATFRVDAHPERTFTGRVDQVRLQPTTNQNVVTYNTIIHVANPESLLMPGMTASVSIIIFRRTDVVRIPNAALRFRPAESGGEARRSRPATERRPGGGGRPAGGGRSAVVYVPGKNGPEPVRVSLGASDGQFVEVREGLNEGVAVITGMQGQAAAPGSPTGSSPFSPQFQRRQR